MKAIYFVGAGGIGMSALERYFNQNGYKVGGYDKTPSQLTETLIKEGIDIHYEDNIDAVDPAFKDKDNCVVCYTPAIPAEHGELCYFQQNGFQVMKRSKILGIVTEQKRGLCVAGTHGKTTTSSMIAHVLKQSHVDCNAFLGGILKLRAACAEEECLGRLGKTYGESQVIIRRMSVVNAVADAALSAVPLCLFLAMGIAAARVMGGEDAMTAADCAGFVSASGMFAAAVMGLVAIRPALVQIRPLYRRVKPLLEAETECSLEDDAPTEDPPPEGDVSVDGVSFSYDGAHPVLDNVTIRAKRGETIAITGASGAGKSTLVRLLLGFERPSSGSVSYDGIDLLRRDPRQLRRALGVVMQNAQVMTNSIFRTIIGETPDLSLDDAWAAAEAAAVADDIRAMPMQMQTILAEGGSVSGGQRQRIMIARALARKPRILILDEATSALDNASQRIVTETLAKLKDVTKIVIAHRLSTVRTADRIYVLDAGRVAEEGTFDELMAKCGLFATLAKRQM